MRHLYFLLPGLGGRFACGGLWAELKTLKIAQEICEAAIVTYRQREPDTLFLADLLKDKERQKNDRIFVVSWGFDVPQLVRQLRGYPVLYHAHSAEYGFKLPAHIPIVTVSRNTLGYWGQNAPHSLLYYLPNEISPHFYNANVNNPLGRDIDVLVQVRKSSHYLLNQLVPALQAHCRVEVIQGFVEDLPALFNRTKVYLYDSAEYWAMQGVTEGFGLQPLEAMACGCQIFSSVNHGLSDYLDPGFNSHKIAGYATDYDVHRILAIVENYAPPVLPERTLAEYRKANIVERLRHILNEVNVYFDWYENRLKNDRLDAVNGEIPKLTRWRVWQLRWQRKWQKLYQMIQGAK